MKNKIAKILCFFPLLIICTVNIFYNNAEEKVSETMDKIERKNTDESKKISLCEFLSGKGDENNNDNNDNNN